MRKQEHLQEYGHRCTERKLFSVCIKFFNYVTIIKPSPQKLKLILITFKNSANTSNKTQCVSIIKINWLTLFKEITAIHSGNHMKTINTLNKMQSY
jgi:hypothetical protein